MEPLKDECVYAVAAEILKNYLSGRRPTLKEISESDKVREFCGRRPTLSTVYYIRRVVDELPRLRSSARRASPGSTSLWSTEPDAESTINIMISWVYHLSHLGSLAKDVSEGTWWGMRAYGIMRGLLSPRAAADYVVSEALRELSAYYDMLEYMVGELTIYRRHGKGYRLKARLRRKIVEGDQDLVRGFSDLLELHESVRGALLEINRIQSQQKVGDPDKLMQSAEIVLRSYLRPFSSKERLARMTGAAASNALLLLAVHRIISEVDRDVSSYIEKGLTNVLLTRVRTRRWRNAIAKVGLSRFLNDLRATGKVNMEPLSEWVGRMPIQISRVWVSESERGGYSFTLSLVATSLPSIGSALFSQISED